MESGHAVTFLKCDASKRAAKSFRRRADGGLRKISYNAGNWFSATLCPSRNIRDLAVALETATLDERTFVVLGRIKPGVDPRRVRRRKRGDDAAFDEIPTVVLPLDLDDIPFPAGLDPANRPEAAVEHVIALLPDELHDATCWWQFTSSAGVEGWDTLRMRLWFWLDRPRQCADLRGWATHANSVAKAKLIDPAVFNAVQPIYLASPVFENMADPVARRFGLRIGAEEVVCLPVLAKAPALTNRSGHFQTDTTFDERIARIGSPECGFHAPLRDAVASYIAKYGAEGLDRCLLKERLRQSIARADPGHRDGATMARYSSDHYLDELIDGALDKFGHHRRRLVPDVDPYFASSLLTKQAAERRLEEEIDEFFDNGGVKLIRAPAGLGKSRAVASRIQRLQADHPFGPGLVHWYVPTVALARELEGLFDSTSTRVVRGRLNEEDGQPLCLKPEVVEAVVKVGLPVQETICRRQDKESGNSYYCPHYEGCPYQEQFEQGGHVFLFAHEYLTLPKQRLIAKPDQVVIDEGFLGKVLSTKSFPLASLQQEGKHAKAVIDVLETGSLRSLRAAYKNKTALRDHAEEIDGHRPDIRPDMNAETQLARLRRYDGERRWQLAACLRALAVEYDVEERDLCHSIELRCNVPVRVSDGQQEEHRVEDRVYVHRRKTLRFPTDTPVLMLDASADPETLRMLFPTLREAQFAVERNAQIQQVHSTRLSKASLSLDRNSPRRLHEVNAILAREARTSKAGLVVTYKSIEERLKIPKGWEVAHFGAIRGLDRWSSVETVVIAGRQQLPPREAEALARCLWVDSPEPLLLPGSYGEEVRGYRLREGRAGVRVHAHPEPRVQRVLELYRERESEQAIDRLRLIHSPVPKRVLVLSNVPLDIMVDNLVSWRDTVEGGGRLQRALETLGDVLPLRADWLAGRFPELWVTKKAAERDIAHEFNNPQTSNRGNNPRSSNYISFRSLGVLRPLRLYAYRIAKQTRPTRALSHLTPTETRTRLEIVLGESLVAFRQIDEN